MYISSVMMDKIYEAKVSPECSADLANIANGVRNGQLWAPKCKFAFLNWLFWLIGLQCQPLVSKVLDSFGMIPTGVLTGHISALGEYEQCRKIKSPVLENGRRIYGKYCQMQARSIIPKVEKQTPHTERVFRSNAQMKQVLEFMEDKMNVDKYLDDAQIVRMLKE